MKRKSTPPQKSPPATSGRSGLRPGRQAGAPSLRTAILFAVLAIVAAAAIYRFTATPPAQKERLFLSDAVTLGSPPPLIESDADMLRVEMQNLEQLRENANQHPADSEAQTMYANSALDAGDPLSALPVFLSLNRSASSADLLFNIGKCQNLLGLCGRALETYEEMVAKYPLDARGHLQKSQTLGLLNRWKESAAAVEVGLSAASPSDVPGLIRLVNQFDSVGDTARALTEATRIHNRSPESLEASMTIVHLLIKLQRPAEAIPVLEDVIKRKPGYAPAHFEMGVVLSSPALPHRNLADAENELLLAQRINPRSEIYFGRLGEYYQDQGKYRQCAYTSLMQLSIAPGSAAARLRLSYAYAHLGDAASAREQGDIAARLLARDQEKSNLQMIVMQHPSDAQANLALAEHHIKYKEFGNALPLLEAALTLSPDDKRIRRTMSDYCKLLSIRQPTPLSQGAS